MLTIVIGNHMGSLTTPTIGSTFPQSSRFDFSFVIVDIRWRMEALNILHYKDKDSHFTYWMVLLSAVTILAHCLVVLHDVLGECKNFIKFTWDLVLVAYWFLKIAYVYLKLQEQNIILWMVLQWLIFSGILFEFKFKKKLKGQSISYRTELSPLS